MSLTSPKVRLVRKGRGPKNLRIVFTSEGLTHFGGCALLHNLFQRLELRAQLSRHVKFDQRNHRYSIGETMLALLYPMILGLGRIETAGLLKHNGVF